MSKAEISNSPIPATISIPKTATIFGEWKMTTLLHRRSAGMKKRLSSLRKSPQPRATLFLLTSFAMFPTRHMCTEVCFSASMTDHRRVAKDTDMPAFMTGRIRSMRSQPESTR